MLRIILVFAFSLFVNDALSCSCSSDTKFTVETLLHRDGLVFEGRVIRIDSIYEKYQGRDHVWNIMATFVVDRWISPRDVSDTIGVYTATEESSCGLSLAVGDKWIMFTDEYDGVQQTSICTWSIKNSGADDKEFHAALTKINSLKSSTVPFRKELDVVGVLYSIFGDLKHGTAVGKWVQMKGLDTTSISNFNEYGRREGYQMLRNEKFDYIDEWYEYSTSSEVKTYESDQKTLRSAYKLKNGRRHGTFEIYYSGSKYLSATYVNGRLEGECITWTEESTGDAPTIKVRTVRQFHQDKMISQVRYNEETGKEID